MQRNWIGRSEGAEADFAVEGAGEKIRVFTTRIDTIFGCTYVVLAPDHPLVAQLTTPSSTAEVEAFVGEDGGAVQDASAPRRAPRRRASSPARTRSTRSPAQQVPDLDRQLRARRLRHRRGDERARARRARLRVRAQVRACRSRSSSSPPRARSCRRATLEAAFTDDGVLVDSGEFTGLPSAEARSEDGARRWRQKGKGKADGHLPPEGLGLLAPALLGHAHPHRLLREVRPGAQGHPGPGEPAAGARCRRSTPRRC